MSSGTVVLGLGSNLNNPLKNIRQALHFIKKIQGVTVLQVSSFFESDAQMPDQAPASWNQKFLNAAILIQVDLISPIELLQNIKSIENQLGRTEDLKWAPRCIDIDILYWHELQFTSEALNIPHLRLTERPFALLPLLQVFPEAKLPRPSWSYDWVLEKPFNTQKSNQYFWPELMGILNLTDDSFSDGGHWLDPEKLQQQVLKLIRQGATILDLGAESTRPGAVQVSEEIEFKRLNEALKIIEKLNLDPSIQISIDSYKSEVLKKCLAQFKIDFVNDVTGLQDEKIMKLVQQYSIKAIAMHSVTVPAKKNQALPNELNPIQFLKKWWSTQKIFWAEHGLSSEQIIFDPGIGFGKSSTQNLFILKKLEQFLQSECKVTENILIGHSRKSYQKIFSDREASDRDLETALVTADLNLAAVQFLRIHDVQSQAITLRYMS